jgi:pimeloyl-ACP methyl ester carboxylesterase
MIETYRWRGGTETLLRYGAGSPITLLILPALFEEANRMRRFTVSVMRNLAALQIGSILPDLPGCGDSLTDLVDVSFADWEDAVASLTDNIFGSVAIRGGALLDADLMNRWRLAPNSGERILRDMIRATSFSEGLTAVELDRRARIEPTRLAGNLISPAFYAAFHKATPVDIAHMTSVEGAKLWRAAEPSHDPDFAHLIAADIAAWTMTCGA